MAFVGVFNKRALFHGFNFPIIQIVALVSSDRNAVIG